MHSYHTFHLLSQANGGDEDVTFDVAESVADKPAELKEAYGGDNFNELDTNNSVAGESTEDKEQQENGKEATLVDASNQPKKKKSEEKELATEDPKKVSSTWKHFSS